MCECVCACLSVCVCIRVCVQGTERLYQVSGDRGRKQSQCYEQIIDEKKTCPVSKQKPISPMGPGLHECTIQGIGSQLEHIHYDT